MEKIKKTILILPAVLIVLFAACSGDSLTSEEAERQAAGQQQAIGFGAYLNRTTRGGAPGSLVTSGASTNQVALQTTGFGVFAYYGDGELYSENTTPNFMYNQSWKQWKGSRSEKRQCFDI